MTHRNTTHVGPLGSAIHVLRADARTVEQLAAIDWSRHFRRVCLDPVRGLITLMSPSACTRISARFWASSWGARQTPWAAPRRGCVPPGCGDEAQYSPNAEALSTTIGES